MILLRVTNLVKCQISQKNNSNRKIEKNVNGTITRYFYDKEAIIAEYDQAGNVIAKYTQGLNIDEPLAMQKNNTNIYYHADGLGSIIALVDTSVAALQTYSYDSFGMINSIGLVTQPYTYTAREFDTETGLYFYRARYYDPKAGRFITRDPIGFDGGINQYAYVGNNPVNWGDARGFTKNKPPNYPDLNPPTRPTPTPDPWENYSTTQPSAFGCCSESAKKQIYWACVSDNVIDNLGTYGLAFGWMYVATGPVGVGAGAAISLGLTFGIADKCNKMANTCTYSR
jgi:RHS repeat-associated protein